MKLPLDWNMQTATITKTVAYIRHIISGMRITQAMNY